VTLTLTLDLGKVISVCTIHVGLPACPTVFEVTLVHISGRGLPTHQIILKSEKRFVDVADVQTDGRKHLSSVSLLGLKMGWFGVPGIHSKSLKTAPFNTAHKSSEM